MIRVPSAKRRASALDSQKLGFVHGNTAPPSINFGLFLSRAFEARSLGRGEGAP